MSNTPVTNNQQEEIDLGYLLNKISQMFKKAVKIFFELIGFFLKYKTFVIILLLLCFFYGWYKDSRAVPVYDNKGIIIPNVESVDYFYDKVEAFNTKIKAKDSIYLKKILDTNYRKLIRIELEPISDIYNFLSKSRENIDIFRIFTQSQDLKDYLDEFSNNKYFKYHKINFRIRGTSNSDLIISQILEHLNNNSHYNEYVKVYRSNISQQIDEHKKMIKQIDSLFKSINIANVNGANGLFISDNSDIHNTFERKRLLVEEMLPLEMLLVDLEKPLNLVEINYNLESEKPIGNSIKYPIYFLILFTLYVFIRQTFNKLKRIATNP